MSFFMSTYSMLSQRHETNDFKFALWFLNQIYKFSSLNILNPFIPRNVKRLLQTWKNRRNADPTPFLFNLSLQIQSINQSNISLKKRRGYSFLNCLRTPLFKKSLNLHKCGHTTMFIGWRNLFSSQHHCTCCWL